VREAREVREEREIREIKEAREAREARERAAMMASAAKKTPPPSPQSNTQVSPQPAAQTGNQSNPVPINNQLKTNRPMLPPTDKEIIDNRSINLNELDPPLSAAQQRNASDLRVSSNQSQTSHPAAKPQPAQGLEPVKPEALKIVPGLPDRHSGKLYKLQIGAFSSLETANKTAVTLKNAGFYAEIESFGSVYRVYAAKISSADVYQASVRLGALGYGQIWVRE